MSPKIKIPMIVAMLLAVLGTRGMAQVPQVTSVSPASPAQPASPIVVVITDSTNTLAVNPATVTVKVDAVAVKALASKVSGVTTVAYTNSAPWTSNSLHSVAVNYGWTGGGTGSTNFTFQTVPWATLPVSLMQPLNSGTGTGVVCNVYQVEGTTVDSIATAELALQGALGQNVADPTTTVSNNTYLPAWPYVDYYQGSGPDGDFQYDNPFPGLPGITGDSGDFADEFLAYVQFPAAGFVRMGVNSQEGFQVTVATGYNTNALVLGAFDGLRQPADTLFTFYVPQPGIWPMRLLYYQAENGGEVEWFSLGSDGSYLLLNDPFPANGLTPLTAYQGLAVATGALLSISLTNGAVSVSWNDSGTLQTTTNLLGTWTAVPNATNPYVTPVTAGTVFFRVEN